MSATHFESFAQNGEDVVLYRALGHIAKGRYIDVGANHPTEDSISWAFYQRGWRGITIEPISMYARLQRERRPDDLLVEAVIAPGESAVIHEVPNTGLSTLVGQIGDKHRQAGHAVNDVEVPATTLDRVIEDAGWTDEPIHFMTIDTEGSEPQVLESINLSAHRPWVLVVEATAPMTSEPTHDVWQPGVLDSGYEFCLFDGLSRFYVAIEHAAELRPKLSYPANVLDEYTTLQQRRSAEENTRLHGLLAGADDELHTLRTQHHKLAQEHHKLAQDHHKLTEAHARLLNSVEQLTHDRDSLATELVAMRESTSWRMTKPLRRLAAIGHPDRPDS